MNAETGTEVAEVVAPVEETAKPEVKADAPEETAEQKAARERDEKGKFVKPVQPRIDELTRQRREAEREAEYWRTRATAREAAEAEAAKAEAAEKPTADKYATYDEFMEALTDWKADQKIEAKLSERDKAQAEKSAADTAKQTWKEREAETIKSLPDYRDVIQAGADTPISDALKDVINNSEFGPKLLYHFAKNPADAERINMLDLTSAARAVGRIELAIEAAEKASSAAPEPTEVVEETPPPAARKTQAPPPAKPVGAGRSTAVPLEKAPMDEFIKRRSAEGARWARI